MEDEKERGHTDGHVVRKKKEWRMRRKHENESDCWEGRGMRE